MRLGIFGGTFDPPHRAHLALAEQALDQLDLDKVLWVLTSNPPHKRGQPISHLEIRLEMLQSAIFGNQKFQLSRVDIDRPPPHFALDTVRLLRREFSTDKLVYLMGGDSLRDLTTWHKPAAFVSACDTLGVVCRPGAEIRLEDLETLIPGITPKVKFVEAPLLEISASDIRNRIREGRPFIHLLPPAVYQIIQNKRLYREQ